jgi:hypothetical protein
MSHGAATPPSVATRALHGAALRTAAQAPSSPDAANAQPGALRTRATAYPFYISMLRFTFRSVGTVMLFAAGIGAGLFATIAWPGPDAWLSLRQPVETVAMKKLTAQLDLTPDQATKIEPIIHSACQEMLWISQEGRADRLNLMDEVANSIQPDLTPAQQTRLEALQSEMQNRPTTRRDQRIVALY